MMKEMKEFPPSWIALAESFLEKARHYTDVRITSHKNVDLFLHNKELKQCKGGSYSGLSVRSITPAFTAFACTSNPHSQTIKRIFNKVERRADSLGKGDLPVSALPADVKGEFKNNDVHSSPGEIAAWLQERIPPLDVGTHVDMVLRIIEERKMVINSENSRLYLDVIYLYLHIDAAYRDKNHFTYFSSDLGGSGSLENLEEKDHSLTETIESLVRCARRLSEASSPPEGMREVILDSKLSGLIAHEIGHTFEADSNTFSPHLLNDVSIPNISIKDNGGSKDVFGWTPFDDEGVKSREITLIKEGEVYQKLHTLQTAAKMNEEPLGSGRAENSSACPMSRMRNTYLMTESEGWSREALLEDSPGALFMEGREGGIKVSSDHFILYPAVIYRVGKGDLENTCIPVSLDGKVKEILENIDAVGKDVQFFPSYCQKRNQGVPVSMGGSLIRTKLRVGRY